MKIGDLVKCPVDLDTGEMFSGVTTLGIITYFHKTEPKIGVTYLTNDRSVPIVGSWFTEEVTLVSEG